jgi:hypothetical protein
VTDIKPFYLHLQPEEKAHLCPIRALAEWLKVSGINKGYLFQRMWSGDRVADLDKNTPMVHQLQCLSFAVADRDSCRPQSSSWNSSKTTSWISILTTTHMGPIPSDVVVANILLPITDGPFKGSVIGKAGALSFQI